MANEFVQEGVDKGLGELTPDQFMAALQQMGGTGAANQFVDEYTQALGYYPDVASFPTVGMQSPMAAFSALDPNKPTAGYIVGETTGAIRYSNGVIADPARGSVIFPTAASAEPETIEGSPTWLSKISQTWSEDKAEKWRKRLADLGFEVEPRGGMAADLLSALADYHRMRYLNFGVPLPLRPGGRKAGEPSPKEVVREAFDRTQAKQIARERIVQFTGDEPSESVVEQWADWLIDDARRLVRNERSPEAAISHLAEEIYQSPQAKFSRRQQEGYELRDGIVGVLQAINGVT